MSFVFCRAFLGWVSYGLITDWIGEVGNRRQAMPVGTTKEKRI